MLLGSKIMLAASDTGILELACIPILYQRETKSYNIAILWTSVEYKWSFILGLSKSSYCLPVISRRSTPENILFH